MLTVITGIHIVLSNIVISGFHCMKQVQKLVFVMERDMIAKTSSLWLLFVSPAPTALFTPIGFGKALAGHVISSLVATDVTQCTKFCLVTEQCKSFNFSDKLKRCQLSGSTAEAHSLEDQEGFNYYERSSIQAISP